jgi:type I restriction enzyme S subunit
MEVVTTRDWPKVTIEEVALDVTVGHVGPMADEYLEAGVPFLRSLSVERFGIREEGLKFISPDFHKKLKKSALAPGDVVIVRTGKPGTCAVVPNWLGDANCSDLVIVRCGPRVRPHFLCYIVNSIAGDHIDAHTVGAVQQHFNVGSARTLSFLLPPIEEQDRILALLRGLDGKIELNRKMNTTLEAMARALFRDWFVDFGPTRAKMAGEAPYLSDDLWFLFPDRLDDEGKPEGWEEKSLGEIVDPRKGRNITRKTVIPGDVPVVAGGLSPAYFHNTPNVIGPVITASASGANAGFIRLYHQDIWASDCSFISQDQTAFLFSIYALLSSRQDEIYTMQQGAAQPHIYPSDLKRMAITDAPKAVWQALEKLLASMFELVASNELESCTLAQTRDLLLPRLMSGELRLADLEQQAS